MPRPPRRRRTREDVIGTPRSAGGSLWLSSQERVKRKYPDAGPAQNLADSLRKARDQVAFLTHSVIAWALNFALHATEGRVPFARYAPGHTGIIPMPDVTKVGLAADWGTGTESAYAVGQSLARAKPDITVHLGDVYYSGDHAEFADYFLPTDCWPRGALGTYALPGNHEMYSGGHAYFDFALRALGQEASYFCLENANWRIVGIDTGYDSTTGLRFVLGQDHTTVHGDVLEWLETVVFADASDRRPVILLSHHQWFTAFDTKAYPDVGRQLEPYLDRVALWFWGHEHRFAGYALAGPSGHTPIRARCIGHGGMPVEIGEPYTPVDQTVKPVFLDARHHTDVGKTPVGYCGYAMLEFDGPTLRVRYVDECDAVLLEETWVRGPDGLRGTAQLHVPAVDGTQAGYGFKLWRPVDELGR